MDQQFAGSSPVLLVHFLTFIRFLSGDAIVPLSRSTDFFILRFESKLSSVGFRHRRYYELVRHPETEMSLNSERLHLGCLEALVAFLGVEGHLLAFVEGAEAAHIDLGLVNEEIGRAVVGSNETKALFGVEPLNRACCRHSILLMKYVNPDILARKFLEKITNAQHTVRSATLGEN